MSANRINRAVELLAEDQPIYSTRRAYGCNSDA